ncbi:phage prohead protein [Odoribacter laneus]|jgi:HK97 family phage prohead protease|uniref:phage prohead protein n=1 Tax=Odoribacter laneus TaxID=626933 RepID=UPI003FEE2DAB
MKIIQKTISNKVEEVTDKGRVIVAINHIGNEDSDHDISMPGSFDETLQSDIGRLKWFLNHDTNILLGVPVKGWEEDGYVKMESQFNLDKQVARDVYSDYKLYKEFGRSLEHSVGVQPLRRDDQDNRKVLQWKMWEYSTLTSWGANSMTPLLDIKSAKSEIEMLKGALKLNYSDERYKNIESMISAIYKAMTGDLIVRCPYCGETFDYNLIKEEHIPQQVLDICNNYKDLLNSGGAFEKMCELPVQVQAEVFTVLKSNKEISEVSSYVHCPKCYDRVYKHNKLLQKHSESKKMNVKSILNKL